MTRMGKARLALAVFVAAVLTATPAMAQTNDGGNAAGAGVALLFTCCWGLIILVFIALFGLWIWMLIDNIQRQEYEFPSSTGNSKNTWLIINLVALVIGFWWLSAIIYFFMVYKKQKRGLGAPPAPPAYAPPPPPPAPPAAPPAPPAPPAPQAPPEQPAPPQEPPTE